MGAPYPTNGRVFTTRFGVALLSCTPLCPSESSLPLPSIASAVSIVSASVNDGVESNNDGPELSGEVRLDPPEPPDRAELKLSLFDKLEVVDILDTRR
jgi:hypothetical protein